MKPNCSLMSKLLITFLAISPLAIRTVCPEYNPVNPQAGENIWPIASRTGTAVDDLAYTSSLCCNCTCFITQADVPNLVISNPGVYCLAENIVIDGAPFTTAISVQSNDVVIDFRGYSITAFAASDDIIEITDHTNVLITDGSITATSTALGIEISGSNNIKVVRCTVSTPDGTPFVINSSNEVTLESCLIHDTIGQGFLFLNSSTNCIIKDCQATRTGLAGGVGAFETQPGCSNLFFTNCSANENFAIGFLIQNNSNLFFTNCSANTNASIGFTIQDSSNMSFNNCSANTNAAIGLNILNSSNISLNNCSAQTNAAIGFVAQSSSNIAFTHCSAYANAEDGFIANSNSSKVTFSDCQANSNGLDGFELEGQYSRAENCVAMSNGAHGFRTNTAASPTNFIEVISSTAKGNTGVGILDGGFQHSRVYNNVSSNNTAGNYLNVVAATLVIPTAVTAATAYCANIDG